MLSKDWIVSLVNMFDMVELLGDSTVGVAMILACFLGVDEGVDLWFAGSDPLLSPRFRLRIDVGDLARDASFVFYDHVVRKIAPKICDLLLDMGVGASAYPLELDEFYGDPMVFKVQKIVPLGSSPCQSFEVLDVFHHPSLLDIFLRPCLRRPAADVSDPLLYVILSSYLHLLILLLCFFLCGVFYV